MQTQGPCPVSFDFSLRPQGLPWQVSDRVLLTQGRTVWVRVDPGGIRVESEAGPEFPDRPHRPMVETGSHRGSAVQTGSCRHQRGRQQRRHWFSSPNSPPPHPPKSSPPPPCAPPFPWLLPRCLRAPSLKARVPLLPDSSPSSLLPSPLPFPRSLAPTSHHLPGRRPSRPSPACLTLP